MKKFKSFCFILVFVILFSQIETKSNDEDYIDYTKIDNVIEGEMAARKIPGMQLGIIQGNEILYIKNYGNAIKENNKPYIVASVTKTFTALAIRQLVNEGKLNDSDKIIKLLPWFKTLNQVQSNEITIKDLLEHTSGFSTYEGIDDYEIDEDFNDLENYVRNLKNVELNPPKTYEYSDVNYNILGLIIEKVSGESYSDYINAHIFVPLEMNNSYVLNNESANNIIGQGYEILFDKAVKSNSVFNNSSVPSGFIASTASDMCKYMVTYLNGNALVNKDYDPSNVKFNEYWEEKDVDLIYHSGFVNNFNSDMSIYPYTGFGIILLSDVDESYLNNISTISDEIYSILTTGDVKISKEGERISEFQSILATTTKILIGAFISYSILVFFSLIFYKREFICKKTYLNIMLLLSFIVPVVLYTLAPVYLNNILDKNMYITWDNIGYFTNESVIWKYLIASWIVLGVAWLIIIYIRDTKNKQNFLEDKDVRKNN